MAGIEGAEGGRTRVGDRANDRIYYAHSRLSGAISCSTALRSALLRQP